MLVWHHLIKWPRTCLFHWMRRSNSLSATSGRSWRCRPCLNCWRWSATRSWCESWSGNVSRFYGNPAHLCLYWSSACWDCNFLIVYGNGMLHVLNRLLWRNLFRHHLFDYHLLGWNGLGVWRDHLCLRSLLLGNWLDLSDQQFLSVLVWN